MAKKKTHEEFINEIEQKYGSDNYTVLTNYMGAFEKVKIRHNLCGYEFWIVPSGFLHKGRKIGCPFCSKINGDSKKRRPIKTDEEFKEEIFKITNGEYSILEKYNGANNKINFIHNIPDCGNVFNMAPNSFLSGRRCPKCSSKQGHDKLSKKFMKTKEQFLIDIETKFNGKISLVGEYTDSFTVTKFYCNKHQIYFDNTPRHVYNSKTGCCPECFANKGEDCYRWKGGVSELKEIVRHFTRDWQIASNTFYGHKCIIKNENSDLAIHHIWKSFADIYQELLDELGYAYNTKREELTDDDLQKIKECTIRLHEKYGLGIPINRKLHEEFHRLYGTEHNTPEQFIEFAASKGVIIEKIDDNKLKVVKRLDT